jgi:hypothetical protein
MRFGLHARDEALYLAGLSEQMRARWNRQLYRLAAREIEASFAEARSASKTDFDQTASYPAAAK